MVSFEAEHTEETVYKARKLWRIGALIEILKSDDAPGLLHIHYQSWPAFQEALDNYATGIARDGHSGITWDEAEAEEETRKVCHALSDFLQSVLDGAEKPDGIPGFFGYELTQHEDGWIEVMDGVYHIWTVAAGTRLWFRNSTDGIGSPIIDNIGGGILRLTIRSGQVSRLGLSLWGRDCDGGGFAGYNHSGVDDPGLVVMSRWF
jgi:hypothetical protein